MTNVAAAAAAARQSRGYARANSMIMTSAQFISQASVFDLRNQYDRASRRTKIIATLGPATQTVESIGHIIDAGTNLCLFNLAHGNRSSHLQCLENLKIAEQQRSGVHLGRILDIPGSELRTKFAKSDLTHLELKAGQELTFCSNISDCPNGSNSITCSQVDLDLIARQQQPLLLSDGKLVVEITNVASSFVCTRVCNDAIISDRQKIHLDGRHLLCSSGSEDCNLQQAIQFAVGNDFDFVAISHIHRASELDSVRAMLKAASSSIKVIVKVEDEEALHNLDEVIEAADALILERGDLGTDVPVEKIFLIQKLVLEMCNVRGKPIIVGGQLLESMLSTPRPTRAEISDVANAVLDGCDGVLLSSETAIGHFAVNAVEILARTCLEAELCQVSPKIHKALHQNVTKRWRMTPCEALCAAAVEASEDANVHVICLNSGVDKAAQLLAKYRPPQIILAASSEVQEVRQLSILRGVYATLCEPTTALRSQSERLTELLSIAPTAHLLETSTSRPMISALWVEGSGGGGEQDSSFSMEIVDL